MQESIIKGKLDNLVGQKTASGKLTMRKRVIPKNPRTSKQIIQRTKFDLAQATARMFQEALDGWAPYAKSKRITNRNALVGYLLKYSNPAIQTPLITVTKDAEGYKGKLEYADLPLSNGNRENLQYGALRFDQAQKITFNIPSNDYENATLIVAVYNPGFEVVRVYRKELVTSQDTQAIELDTPLKWTGEEVHVYAYVQIFDSREDQLRYGAGPFESRVEIFNAAAAAEYSPSAYLGNGTIG